MSPFYGCCCCYNSYHAGSYPGLTSTWFLMLFSGYILAIDELSCQILFHSLIPIISTNVFTTPEEFFYLNTMFMLSFFQNSDNEPWNRVTNFFQDLSAPSTHIECYSIALSDDLHIAQCSVPFTSLKANYSSLISLPK